MPPSAHPLAEWHPALRSLAFQSPVTGDDRAAYLRDIAKMTFGSGYVTPTARTRSGQAIFQFWHASDLRANSAPSEGQLNVTPGWFTARPGQMIVWEWFSKNSLPGVAGRWADLAVSHAELSQMYAVPYLDLATTLPDVSDATRARVVKAAQTYVDAGDKLVWAGNGTPGAGLGTPFGSPYPHSISCSHFTGLLLWGIEYPTSRYSQATNEVTSPRDSSFDMQNTWQAMRQAEALFSAGRLAFYGGEGVRDPKPGDLLFWTVENPEGSWDRANQASLATYFGNVYHVAMSLGGRDIVQSSHPTSDGGVYKTSFDDTNLPTFLGAPDWKD